MILDTVAQCVMMLSKSCGVLFARIPHADPSSQACAACKQIAYKAIAKVLYATTPQAPDSPAVRAAWAEMSSIRAPKAWMFGHEILGMFVANISGVDDRRWAGWWAANGLGRSGYGWVEFSRLLLAKHSANVVEHMKRKAIVPPALKPATNDQVADLAASMSTRPAAPAPVVVESAEEPTTDVGDLQPDVQLPTAEEHMKTLGDINALPAAESFEPPPQATAAPSADEVRATSGPASRKRGMVDSGQKAAKKASAHVRLARKVVPVEKTEEAAQ